jgi:ubiquitin C-terminal hydrolase
MLLNNFGNTCYINSVLQIFLNNEYFMNHVKSKTYETTTLLHSFKCINSRESLKVFLLHLQDKMKDKMRLNDQNDVNEMYTFLLELFEEEDPDVAKLFIGTQKKIFKCMECENKRDTRENFTSLNLYTTFDNLKDSIMDMFNKEILNGIECDYCHKKTKTETRCKISRWPRNLVMTINRFSVDCKIEKNFDYTKNIELSISGKITKYKLIGIINHLGVADFGHYTYIKIDGESCTEIDDDKLRTISNYKSPYNYLLVYTTI